MRRLILALALLGLAFWQATPVQAQSCNGCGIGFWRASLPLSGGTLTGPLLLPDGTFAAPSLSFANETDKGFYSGASNRISVTFAGSAENIRLTANIVGILSNSAQFQMGSNLDTIISWGAANTVQLGVNAATATAQALKGPNSTGATIAGGNLTIRAGDGTSGIANGGQLILGGGLNSSTGEPGAVQLEDRGTKPTCAAEIRGSIWYDAAGAGAADTIEVCAHKSDNSYAWIALATPIS